MPALVVSMLAMVSTFVNWFILPFFVVESLGTSASVWGLLLMLMTVANALWAPVGGWLSDRWHPAYTITAGLVSSTAALVSLSAMDEGSSVVRVALGLIFVGVGTGLFQSANAEPDHGRHAREPPRHGRRHHGPVSRSGHRVQRGDNGSHLLVPDGGAGVSLPEDQAFILAFQDTYMIAVVLGAVAIAVSCTIWPVVVRRRM